MNGKLAVRRRSHSFRERIRQAIMERAVLGKPLNVRAIIQDAGGGSASTVLEELARIEPGTPGTRFGHPAKTLPERLLLLENALDAAVARERELAAENHALTQSLHEARLSTEKLLAMHHDAQCRLMQAVDDLRQMVKAGQRSMPHGIIETERLKRDRPDGSGEESEFWKARHDQLVEDMFRLKEQNRRMASLLHELGALDDF